MLNNAWCDERLFLIYHETDMHTIKHDADAVRIFLQTKNFFDEQLRLHIDFLLHFCFNIQNAFLVLPITNK
jgi:hypothetical protein